MQQLFPCTEQPLRVTLVNNGSYYLRCCSKGRRVSVARHQRRPDLDEFRLQYDGDDRASVELIHHRTGAALSVVVQANTGDRTVEGVKDEETESTTKDSDAEAESQLISDAANNTITSESSAAPNTSRSADKPNDDRKWCFVRASNVIGGNQAMLKSARTDDFLGVDSEGKVILVADPTAVRESAILWDIDCVTGELCFVSNPALDQRLRCDMAGLLMLTSAWKGWEVFRFMEAGHGYVKISSWMHQQWLLCSAADGTVTTCKHVESIGGASLNGLCCLWAIETFYPSEAGNDRVVDFEGVIIRNKTHGRLLSVHNGVLKTFLHGEEAAEAMADDEVSKEGSSENWWTKGIKDIRSGSMRSVEGDIPAPPPQEATTVWQLEAAHQQTYYFAAVGTNGSKTMTIGPLPLVSPNLRQSSKIQLRRDGLVDSVRLWETQTEQYITCAANGGIVLLPSCQDNPDSEWTMEAPEGGGGSAFRSKQHNLYLSYDFQTVDDSSTSDTDPPVESQSERLKRVFLSRSDPSATLGASPSLGPREAWALEPCMPRAVSSEKIATFALGTSIAVGTTIAMPFALAGASALLGVVGAEAGVLFNAIAVGLTGAEALASVGAIGATAYIVFRPAENSLTDKHTKDEEEEERAWSKRPLSNWRNW